MAPGVNIAGSKPGIATPVLVRCSQRDVVPCRYGLNREGQKVPRAEISKAFGTTTLKITQLEHLAWDKIMTGWRQEFIARRTVDVAALDA